MQCTLSGAASSRAGAIGPSQRSQRPYVPSSTLASARRSFSSVRTRLFPTPISLRRVMASVVPSPMRLPNPMPEPGSSGLASSASRAWISSRRARRCRARSVGSSAMAPLSEYPLAGLRRAQHGHDLELGEVAPASGPLVEQRGIVGLHELEAAVEPLVHPAVDVHQPVGQQTATLDGPLVNR